uniref:Secreted protein n=1 Tax=Octopus bimaculoides TaxID=37653 RepID=A0A0L8H2B5_OCTBM
MDFCLTLPMTLSILLPVVAIATGNFKLNEQRTSQHFGIATNEYKVNNARKHTIRKTPLVVMQWTRLSVMGISSSPL